MQLFTAQPYGYLMANALKPERSTLDDFKKENVIFLVNSNFLFAKMKN